MVVWFACLFDVTLIFFAFFVFFCLLIFISGFFFLACVFEKNKSELEILWVKRLEESRSRKEKHDKNIYYIKIFNENKIN